MVLPSDVDLLHPPLELDKRNFKLKRLEQIFGSQTVVLCQPPPPSLSLCRAVQFKDVDLLNPPLELDKRNFKLRRLQIFGSPTVVLCQPTGGRARLTEGCTFRRKGQ